MKKHLFIILACGLIILTGCGQKTDTLSCIKAGKGEQFSLKQETIITFEKEKISKLENKSYTEFGEEAMDGFDTYYNTLSNSLNIYNDKPGIKLNITKGENSITTSVIFDIATIAKNESEDLTVDPTATKEQVIAELELDGYTCK